jgi:uncharacterized protein YegP (UPF0339 family)
LAVATAIRKPLSRGDARRNVTDVRVSPMEFLVVEDNAGAYYWTIVADDGAPLARSGGFASYDLATQAAEHIRDGVASARFGPRVAGVTK